MNGPEHYREGERILAAIAPARARWDGDLTDVVDTEAEQVLPFGLWSLNLAYARTHFAAAQAAATPLNALVIAGATPWASLHEWLRAVGVDVEHSPGAKVVGPPAVRCACPVDPDGPERGDPLSTCLTHGWTTDVTAPTTDPASTEAAETGTPVGTDTPNPAEAVSACCGGSGLADYAAVPCPNPQAPYRRPVGHDIPARLADWSRQRERERTCRTAPGHCTHPSATPPDLVSPGGIYVRCCRCAAWLAKNVPAGPPGSPQSAQDAPEVPQDIPEVHSGAQADAWTHGTRLGREHRSVRQHLIEDHGENPAKVEQWSDGAVHGAHDGAHGVTWAYAQNLPHPAGGRP